MLPILPPSIPGENPLTGLAALVCSGAVLTLGHGTVFAGLLIGLYIGSKL
jgi:hypothetical protein